MHFWLFSFEFVVLLYVLVRAADIALGYWPAPATNPPRPQVRSAVFILLYAIVAILALIAVVLAIAAH